MTYIEIIILSIGLAMDAFAVSICKGMCMKKISLREAGITALAFGGFQALMPAIGYRLGIQFSSYIDEIDHWIAFGLLAFLGLRVIFSKEDEVSCKKTSFIELILMSIATSLDAFAVGITFALVKDIKISTAILTIGAVTFTLCFLGAFIGHYFGVKFKRYAELTGGFVLIAIGTRLLILGLF